MLDRRDLGAVVGAVVGQQILLQAIDPGGQHPKLHADQDNDEGGDNRQSECHRIATDGGDPGWTGIRARWRGGTRFHAHPLTPSGTSVNTANTRTGSAFPLTCTSPRSAIRPAALSSLPKPANACRVLSLMKML